MFTIYIQYLLTRVILNLHQSLHNRETITMFFLVCFFLTPAARDQKSQKSQHGRPAHQVILPEVGPWGCRDARHWIQISWGAIERATNYWGNGW